MALFSLSKAHLAYGHFALLDEADFSIEAGERVGLIGRNGTGKSSLLQIVAARLAPDDGLIARQSGLTVSYVAQEPAFDPAATVFDIVAAGFTEIQTRLAEFDALTATLDAGDDAQLARLQQLTADLDARGAWSLKHRVETTLAQLQLDGAAQLGDLSGGTQKRVALAQGLVTNPDLLLLDEPTNHLDIDAVVWLEALLLGFPGSVLLITHDRAFLDRVSTRIVELDRGKLTSFPGNFSAYQARKAQQLENEAVENAKFDKLLAQEEVWIRKGVEARRTRSVSRIARLQQLRSERAQRREVQGRVKMDIAQAQQSGKIVAELERVSKHYDGKPIVDDFSATIMRGDKVGLIGPNGAGKTTLLKLILGQLKPDAGTVKNGTQLEIAYFDQMRAQLDLDQTLADTISPGSDWVEINGQRKHLISYLGDFLFAPERARSPVKSLSGGERNRLLLARLFARPANLLVLDEPTNDLDIDTLELLEERLTDYPGTVFLVSHDRAFVDGVVTSVIASEGHGRWRETVGGYSDWQRENARVRVMAATLADKASSKAAAKPVPETAQPVRGGNRSAKLSFNEQRELSDLPDRIDALETEQKAIGAELEAGAVYASDPARAQQLAQRFAQLEEELFSALERWEALDAKQAGRG